MAGWMVFFVAIFVFFFIALGFCCLVVIELESLKDKILNRSDPTPEQPDEDLPNDVP